jgi:predicted aspartyl protease
MPILHTQFTGQGTNPQGQTVQIEPKIVLQNRGPIIQVTVALAAPFAQSLQQAGQTVPAPISGWALVDTGASDTCIDGGHAQQMGLPVIDVVNLTSATHVNTLQNVYPIRIEFAGVPIAIDAPRAIAANLTAQGLLLLIGRDVLQHCTFIYNGLAGSITFCA